MSLSGKIVQDWWRVHHHLQYRIRKASIAEILEALCMSVIHWIGRPCNFHRTRPEVLCAGGCSRG